MVIPALQHLLAYVAPPANAVLGKAGVKRLTFGITPAPAGGNDEA
jgi:hypothetical protein